VTAAVYSDGDCSQRGEHGTEQTRKGGFGRMQEVMGWESAYPASRSTELMGSRHA
jgi:hypothetical protein